MPIVKCRMCGNDIELTGNRTWGTCERCGGEMTFPTTSDPARLEKFNRASELRRKNAFDLAINAYDALLDENEDDAEAHWGALLSWYGIEYVEDPATHAWIPTCHRAQMGSIITDPDYQAALDNAPDDEAKALYEREAGKIAEIQKGILAISEKEPPYDVFICYKEQDESGERTVDSTLAQDIYYQLTGQGYRVFFARLTLEDKLGQEYEPYIFAALRSARVMLVVGTKPERFNAVWVRNEWSRFLSLMKNDRSRLLIPCYRDMDPYKLPKELSSLQSQDMGRIGFIQDVIHGVRKVLDANKPRVEAASAASAAPSVDSLLKRARLFLGDGNWTSADEYAEKALGIDPECAEAYIIKTQAARKVFREAGLAKCEAPLTGDENFEKALRFADAEQKERYEVYQRVVDDHLRKNREAQESGSARQTEASRAEADALGRKAKEVAAEPVKTSAPEPRPKIVRIASSVVGGRRRDASAYPGVGAVSGGSDFTVGLKADGTLVAVGNNLFHRCNVFNWTDIVAVSAGNGHTVGLKADGTVVATGLNMSGQCNVSDWQDIVAVSAGSAHTVGLRADGTVVAVGQNKRGQCNVTKWTDIVAVAAGSTHTVGLKADGTVVAAGSNQFEERNVADWRDIVAVSAGYLYTVGLKKDGTVVAVGKSKRIKRKVADWRDIVAISAGQDHVVGLKPDGTVVAVGSNLTKWTNIVAVSAGAAHTVGLKADGTVVANGSNGNGRCRVFDWDLLN